MKNLIVLMFFIFLANLCTAAFTTSIEDRGTWDNAYVLTGNIRDKFLDWCEEVEDSIDGTDGFASLYFIPTATASAPTATEGTMFYDSTTDTIKYRNASAWISLTGLEAGAAGTLDDSYNSGFAIDVDGTAVTLTVSDGDNNAALIVAQNDSTNDPDAMNITSAADAATAVGLQIDCTAGFDIQGTSDSWSVSIAGLFDGEGLTGVTHSQGILFDTNNEIQFGDNSEDIAFNFATANTVTLATDTGVDSFAFGVVDDLEGVGTITFDDAASTISLTSTGETDLTIQQATADQDASLILQSSGTGTDALSLISSVADIKISSADNIDIDAADNIAIDTAGGAITATTIGGDITLDASDSSVIIRGTEAAADAITIIADTAAGGIDISSQADIDITTAGAAGEDITIANTGGSVNITASEADAGAILIQASAAGGDVNIDSVLGRIEIEAEEDASQALYLIADGGTSSSIEIFNDTGTGASATTEHDASIQVQSDAGGISLYTTGNVADAVRIETNGGTSETITINNLQGTGADAVTIAANAAGGDVNIDSVLGRIEIEAEEDVANALYLIADGGTSSSIQIFNDTGTSVTENAASINIWSDAGGIAIQSDANLDDALVLRVDGGTSSEMTLHNDQGDTTDSIELLSDAGGISLNAAKPVAITNAFELDVVAVPNATPYTVLVNNSGQVHFIPDFAADTTINLPVEADGMHYKFVFIGGAEDAQDWIIDTGNNLNYFVGGIVQHDIDGELVVTYYSDGDSNSKIGVLTPGAGTFIEMWCTGTTWYVTGSVVSATDAGVTFADQ